MRPTEYTVVTQWPTKDNPVAETATHLAGDDWMLMRIDGVFKESYFDRVDTDYVASRCYDNETIRHATKAVPVRYLCVGDKFRYRGSFDGYLFKVVALETDADFTGHLHAKILQPDGECPYMEPCYIPLDQMVVKEI